LTALKNKTVLVVDDEPVVAKFAQTVLERAGYTVMTANDGAEALQFCERHDGEIDLLLTDIQMPRLNGLELVQRLVEQNLNMPVLFMTGYKGDAELKGPQPSAKEREALLQKPFTPARLLGAIENALHSPG
jgi:two-component system cell cycle sensor histidine kinase/response regulator CckA